MFDIFKKKEKTQDEIELEKLREEAKKEAMKELKPELIRMYKDQEMIKMKKKSKNWGEVLAKEFADVGDSVFSKEKMEKVIKDNTQNQGDMFSRNKIDNMMDDTDNNTFSKDKIDRMLDHKNKKNPGDNWI